MATAQKKNAGGKRTASGTGRTASGSRAAGSRKKAPAPRPIRREVGAVACLLLAIFSAFGYFHIQAIFIDFFCGLVKGLIGYGYWLLPPMLLVASGILVFHRGRPVRLRGCFRSAGWQTGSSAAISAGSWSMPCWSAARPLRSCRSSGWSMPRCWRCWSG